MSEDEDDAKEKVQPTVSYLQKLGPTYLDLIFQTSSWVFDIDKQSGLEVGIQPG